MTEYYVCPVSEAARIQSNDTQLRCNVEFVIQDISSSSGNLSSGVEAAIDLLFTNPDYISAFSLGCLGAWALGVMFGHVFKFIGKLRS